MKNKCLLGCKMKKKKKTHKTQLELFSTGLICTWHLQPSAGDIISEGKCAMCIDWDDHQEGSLGLSRVSICSRYPPEILSIPSL